jgi:hypothetical protein
MIDPESLLNIIEKGLRGETLDNLVEGWSFRIDEVSSNVYRVEGTDTQGHHASSHGTEPEEVLLQCIKNAHRISHRTQLITDLKTYVTSILRLKK